MSHNVDWGVVGVKSSDGIPVAKIATNNGQRKNVPTSFEAYFTNQMIVQPHQLFTYIDLYIQLTY